VKQRDVASHARLGPDEMVRAFVMCGKPESVRERIERAWTVADSLCLVPPVYGLPLEKLAAYAGMTAKLFYD
jgi:alkanesulfonate monooxygenase SsuD/methylene tetrahydromethanopterin reductase-like flavin-dependent oxidoreductase (luciferase family)